MRVAFVVGFGAFSGGGSAVGGRGKAHYHQVLRFFRTERGRHGETGKWGERWMRMGEDG